MKKIALSLASLAVLALPVLAFAQIGGDVPELSYNLTDLGNNIARATWIIFTIIAVIMFVVSAIYFLTAGGEPEKVQKARSSFIWGIAGVVVAILAFTIITLTTSIVNGGN